MNASDLCPGCYAELGEPCAPGCVDAFWRKSLAAVPGVCPHHDAAHVCDECPVGFCTNSAGFAHRTALRGRTALRRCRGCRAFVTREEWSIADWFHCLACVAKHRGEGAEP